MAPANTKTASKARVFRTVEQPKLHLQRVRDEEFAAYAGDDAEVGGHPRVAALDDTPEVANRVATRRADRDREHLEGEARRERDDHPNHRPCRRDHCTREQRGAGPLSFDQIPSDQRVCALPGSPLELELLLFESMTFGGSHQITQRAGRSSAGGASTPRGEDRIQILSDATGGMRDVVTNHRRLPRRLAWANASWGIANPYAARG